MDKDIQCTVLNVKPSGLSWLCLAFWLVTPFLSNSLKALVTGTVTNGFPSVTSVLQHLVFKMSFHDVLFTAPSPLPGGDEKVILIFQRSPVNYSTGLCIAYSLQLGKLASLFWWVELYLFSLECNEVSSSGLWGIYGCGVTFGRLYFNA